MDVTVLTADVSKEAAYEIDLDIAVDSADKIWFTAKRTQADIDTDAVLRKGRNATAPYDAGITVTDNATGKLKVQVTSADWPADFTDEALVFDVQIKRVSPADVTPYVVARGIIRCTQPITIVDT